MPNPAVIKRLAEEFASRKPMRATSLIVTVFGDAISQHGGDIWLGSLVRALAGVGINERLVRTSVFRLVQEGWLESERVGRRSYYRFSEYGSHEYERAARRIYAMEREPWNGQWQLLIPLSVPDELRERFRRSLLWQGFRTIAPGTFAKPGSGGRALRETLAEFELEDKVLVMEAKTLADTPASVLAELVQVSWRLDEVAERYRKFLTSYRPLARWLEKNGAPGPQAAFVARTLLIHDYRRVLLQGTRIPGVLLPRDWPGAEAEQLTASVYRKLAPASAGYICGQLEGESGPLAPPAPEFDLRFAQA